MKTSMKKYLSLVLAICCIFACFIIPNQAIEASAASYSETEFGEGKFLIVTKDNSGNIYYLPTAAATGSGPKKVTVSSVNDIPDENLWTVTSAGDGKYYIQNSGGLYLNTIKDNSGVRVSNTKDSWTYDSKENSLKSSSQSRYLGVYTSGSDWRCYTTVGQNNYNGTSKNFEFYKVNEVDDSISTPLNAVNAYMSLGYKYTARTEYADSTTTVDTLTRSSTGATSTSYVDWTHTATSGAKYVGQSAGDKTSIQLRSKNNNSGIVTTASGGNVTKITVTWHADTASGKILQVYGSNTPYSAATDLYNTSKQGTSLGKIVKGTSTELVIEGDYKYIGLRSADGAIYLTNINISYESEGGEQTVYNNSDFALRCAIDDSIADIAGVDSFGIKVSTGSKSMEYTSTAKSWTHDEENGLYYITLNLGNIINDLNKLDTEFTVMAFVTVGENTFASTTTKTHSVASMINDYYKNGSAEVKAAVEHLYNYLDKEGLI